MSPKNEKRSFTVISVSTSTKQKGKENFGRYISKSPAGAARKAGSKVCGMSKIRGQCTLTIALRETTQGSKGKVYVYKVKRVVVNHKVEIDGKIITHKYAMKSTRIKDKTKSTTPSIVSRLKARKAQKGGSCGASW
jgi:hypothetical protein